MRNEIHMDDKKAQRLHYDVMGIALAVRGNAGECALYQEMDRALTSLDWRKMAIIQHAFELLPDIRQRLILEEGGKKKDIDGSIDQLNRNLRMMVPLPRMETA